MVKNKEENVTYHINSEEFFATLSSEQEATYNDNPITKVSFVNILSGTKIHGVLANEGLDSNGGDYQFYIIRDQFESTYANRDWFSEPAEAKRFLN